MEMVTDVLQILRARGALNKTELIYAANLNYERASWIINWLIEHELITVESGKYWITENGEALTAVRLPHHRDILCYTSHSHRLSFFKPLEPY
jgi:predicted transcriptional regulator